MRKLNDGAACHLLFSVALTAWFPAAAAIVALPARNHNAISFLGRQKANASSVRQAAGDTAKMGRVVEHGGVLYMNGAIPGQIWGLKPTFDANPAWNWYPAGNAYGVENPGAPINYPVDMMPGPAPAGMIPPPSGAPPGMVPAASPGPAPGPAPVIPCSALIALAQNDAKSQGMFLGCQEFRYYGSNVMGQGAPYGCHCASWTVNCPFEACPIGSAFDEMCLAAPVKQMGFTALSKMSNFVNPASVPKGLRPFTKHPDYISTCMYWLPKPANPSLPTVDAAQFNGLLPDFATFYFTGTTFAQCAEQMSSEAMLMRTKMGLLSALGERDLQIVSVTCGSMSALLTGPKDQLMRAGAKAKSAAFCFQGATKPVCTMPQAHPVVIAPPMWGLFGPNMRLSYPGPGPAPAPRPAR